MVQIPIIALKRLILYLFAFACGGYTVYLWHSTYFHGFFSSIGLQVKGQHQNEVPGSIELVSKEEIESLDQKDKRLWNYIRAYHIIPPSTLSYSFGDKTKVGFSEADVDNKLYPLFKNKERGFFVEVGAYDGIYSHTLKLEKHFHWNGLLIECNPNVFPKLKKVHRKAYLSDVCLSGTNFPSKAILTSMDKSLGSSSLGEGDVFPSNIPSNFTKHEVQTIPLFSIIASIDVSEVDLIALDVQSLELDVLKYFPFDLVLVKVWLVEISLFKSDQREWLIQYMETKGYPSKRTIKLKWDYIFIHNTFN